MPRSIKNSADFEITRTVDYDAISNNYKMPCMAAVTDHYEISLTISGDRYVNSNDSEWYMHSGYVGTIPLNLLHKTSPASNQIYDRILVKYSFKIADSLKNELSPSKFEKFYNERFHVLCESDAKYVQTLFEKMLCEANTLSTFANIRLKSILLLAVTYIMEHELNPKITEHPTKKHNILIDKAMRYIEQNYASDITLETVSQYLNFSAAHFSRLFKKTTGDTFSSYLSNVRYEHASALLTTTDMSVENIAAACGFGSASYFSMAFKKKFMTSPQKYRKQNIHQP